MRRVLAAVAMLLAGGGPALVETQTPAVPTIAFVNGWWFNGNGFERRTGFSVNRQFSFKTTRPIDRTLDLDGAFVVPPFGEAHNHNLGPGPDTLERATRRRYLADGVFYVKIQGNAAVTDTLRRGMASGPDGVDAVFAQGSITASGGHPITLVEDVLLPRGALPGYTKDTVKDSYYFTVDSEVQLRAKWPAILAQQPDFIKTYLLFSEQFETRRADAAFDGQKGLDPRLLPAIVARAHAARLRVSTHVATGADFHHAVGAGVDEIAHLPSVGDPIAQADAALAAKRGIVVISTYRNAVPTLIRLGVAKESDIRRTELANFQLLLRSGVRLAIGSDDVTDTSVKEIEFLQSLGVADNLALLRMWCQTTPRAIFPGRQIGRLDQGYEASFLALEGNPLEDFHNVRRIKLRVRQGVLLEGERPGFDRLDDAVTGGLMNTRREGKD